MRRGSEGRRGVSSLILPAGLGLVQALPPKASGPVRQSYLLSTLSSQPPVTVFSSYVLSPSDDMHYLLWVSEHPAHMTVNRPFIKLFSS